MPNERGFMSRRLVLALFLVCGSESWARPPGPMLYLGPQNDDTTSGLEAKKHATALSSEDDDAVERDIIEYSAFGFLTDDSVSVGGFLSFAHQGRYDFGDGGSQKDVLGMGTGAFLRYHIGTWANYRAVASFGYDVLFERGEADGINTKSYTRDASLGLGVAHDGLGILTPYLGISGSKFWGTAKHHKGDDALFSSPLTGKDPLTFEGGAYFQFSKFTVGLVGFHGNQKGVALSFFATPRGSDEGQEQRLD